MPADPEALKLMVVEGDQTINRLNAHITSVVSKGANLVTVMFVILSTSILLVTLFNQWIFVFSLFAFVLLLVMFYVPIAVAIFWGVYSFLSPHHYSDSDTYSSSDYSRMLEVDEVTILNELVRRKEKAIKELDSCLERDIRRFENVLFALGVAGILALIYMALVSLVAL